MQLRLRYIFRLISAFFKKFKGVIVLSVIIGIIVFFLLRLFIPLTLKKNTQKIGVVGKYTVSQLPENISQLISSGLTISNISGELEPGIASQWESPDQGKTWIFHIDENLKWQDGKQVVSEDINYDFNDVIQEKPDNETITFKLKNAFSPFPAVVARPIFKRGLMGVGEWQVDKISLKQGNADKLILVNNNQKKIIKFYPTEERVKLALKLGEIQKISEVYNPSPFENWKIMKLEESVKYNQIIVLFFNNKSDNVADKTVRQALNYAIDKDSSKLVRSISPISPLSWAYNPQVKNYSYDPAKAKSTLNNMGNKLTITLQTTPLLVSIADKIASDWKEIGVGTSVVASPGVPSEFDAFLAILDIPDDPDQYSLWHSTQVTTNISKYQSQRIDKLLEDGRAELNLEARKKIYLDFQRYLIEDCPAIFLYHPTVYTIERK